MPSHSQIEKYLDGKVKRSELIKVQCSGCGAEIQIREGNREYQGQLAAGFPVTVYCVPCEDARRKQGFTHASIGIPRCNTCGSGIELATHGGVLYGQCDNNCRSGWYYSERLGSSLVMSEPPQVIESVLDLLEILDELSETEGKQTK